MALFFTYEKIDKIKTGELRTLFVDCAHHAGQRLQRIHNLDLKQKYINDQIDFSSGIKERSYRYFSTYSKELEFDEIN